LTEIYSGRTAGKKPDLSVNIGKLRMKNPVTTGHEEPRGNPGGPPPKAKYPERPIVNKYREGKVKSTPGGE
jgi:hypothetical protein